MCTADVHSPNGMYTGCSLYTAHVYSYFTCRHIRNISTGNLTCIQYEVAIACIQGLCTGDVYSGCTQSERDVYITYRLYTACTHRTIHVGVNTVLLCPPPPAVSEGPIHDPRSRGRRGGGLYMPRYQSIAVSSLQQSLWVCSYSFSNVE
jgi:hypothetical protein